DYFSDGSRLGLTIRYAREPEPLGTGGALRNAGSLLADSFLLIYGDSYLPIPYRPVWQHLLDTGVVAVAVVYDNRANTTVPNNIALDADGFVTRYDKEASPGPEFRYVEAGVLALRRAVLDEVPPAPP